jgi:hypothetical protein
MNTAVAKGSPQPFFKSRLSRPAVARRILITLGCLLGLAVNCYLKLPVLPRIIHGDNDFMGFYTGAKLAGSDQLYNPNAVRRAQAPLWDHPRFLPLVRLPFYPMFISPLRLFSYQTAYWIWQVASLAAVLLLVYFWPAPQRWLALMACCWSAPLLTCFVMGQDITMVMMVLTISLALLFSGRHFWAGCVFSLCLIKFNLFLPVPLLIMGKRLWRFGGGMLAGGAVLMALSFAVGGWSWPLQYAALLRLPTTTPSYDGMPNLHGLFSNWPHSMLLEAGGACLVMAAAWLVMRGGEIRHAIAAMLVSGLLISHHAFFQDAFILAPASLCMMQGGTNLVYRLVGILLLSPLAYLAFLVPVSPFPPAAVFLLPLAVMAAGEIRKGRNWGPLRLVVTLPRRVRGGRTSAGDRARTPT